MICFWHSVQNLPKHISRWNLGKQESILRFEQDHVEKMTSAFLTTQNWTRFPNTNDASLPAVFATAIVCCKAPLCWTKDWYLTKASANEMLMKTNYHLWDSTNMKKTIVKVLLLLSNLATSFVFAPGWHPNPCIRTNLAAQARLSNFKPSELFLPVSEVLPDMRIPFLQRIKE